MTTQPDNWNRVKVTVRYVDRGTLDSQSVELDRQEMEREEKERMLANVQAYAEAEGAEDKAQQWRETAERYTLSQAEFLQRVVGWAKTLATNPFQVPGHTANRFRILPPWAIKEVEVEAVGAANIITLS